MLVVELVKLLSGELWKGMYVIHGLLWVAMIELLLCIGIQSKACEV